MTDQEKTEWAELYEYVRSEILFYDKSQSIPSNLVLRLKGLTTGKYIENRNIEDKAAYSYKVVLYTFQACRPEILRCINVKSFKNETVKFNYICKIVENNINDVYLRLKRAEETRRKAELANTDIATSQGAEYSHKTESLKNKDLNDLW